jgi:type 1 fimbria pilin
MKRMMFGIAVIVISLFSINANAQDKHEAKTADKSVTITGEVVDLGCYLGHGAKGADHKSCALKCISGGMPMGLLTSDGKLYLLTMSHETADPFNAVKDLAAEQVSITGSVFERNGMKSLEVDQVKQMSGEKKPAKG